MNAKYASHVNKLKKKLTPKKVTKTVSLKSKLATSAKLISKIKNKFAKNKKALEKELKYALLNSSPQTIEKLKRKLLRLKKKYYNALENNISNRGITKRKLALFLRDKKRSERSKIEKTQSSKKNQ
jgi:hypothetical protein